MIIENEKNTKPMKLREKLVDILYTVSEDEEACIDDYVDEIIDFIKDCIDGKEIK